VPTSVLRAVVEAQTAAAEAKLKAFGNQLDSTAKKGSGILGKFSAVGIASFAAVGAAAIAFAGDAIKSYEESEKALINLNTTLKNVPQLAGATTKAFEDQASALQKVTMFSDESILNADAVLGRYSLTEQQLKSLTPAVLDFATATGTDAATAAEGIGKALLGSTKALKAVGIEFHATGNRAKDVATIMDALQGKVGGMAVAMGDTAAGKAAELANAFDDVKETIGGALVPILGSLETALGPVLEAFGQAAKGLQPLLKLLGEGMGEAAKLFLLSFKPIFMLLDLFGEHIHAIGNFFITNMVNPIITGLNAMLDAFDKALGPFINFPDIPKLKTLATDVRSVGSAGHFGAGGVGYFTDAVGGVPGVTDPASDSTRIFGSYLGVVATQAETAASRVKIYLDNLHALAASPIATPGSGGVKGGYATGIWNSPTTHFAMVGEQGPELMLIPRGGSILPASQTREAMANAGSSVTVNVHVHGDVNGMDDFERKVEGVVVKAFSRAVGR
jgi:hypothetical protein